MFSRARPRARQSEDLKRHAERILIRHLLQAQLVHSGTLLDWPSAAPEWRQSQVLKSQFWIYCHEIDKQGPVAQQIYSDQNETPLLSPHLSNRADRNRNSHEEDETEIGNWSEANQICISLGNEPLSIRQRLGCFAAKSPPAGSLSNHKQADPNADYARRDKDNADSNGEFSFHVANIPERSAYAPIT